MASFLNTPDEYKKPVTHVKVWPDNQGCDGNEINHTLFVGNYIDRFGSKDGFFFGIPGDVYINRSLPWFGNYTNDPNQNEKIKDAYNAFYSSCDRGDNKNCDYRLYKVIKQFDISSCLISPAFGYPGGGTQYRSNISVSELIRIGFIQEVGWTHYPFFDNDNYNRQGGFVKRHHKRNTKRRQKHKKTKRKLYK